MLQQIYLAFGGTNKGITFRDLLCGLVLLTRGTREEKIKCKFGICSRPTKLEHIMIRVVVCDNLVPTIY